MDAARRDVPCRRGARRRAGDPPLRALLPARSASCRGVRSTRRRRSTPSATGVRPRRSDGGSRSSRAHPTASSSAGSAHDSTRARGARRPQRVLRPRRGRSALGDSRMARVDGARPTHRSRVPPRRGLADGAHDLRADRRHTGDRGDHPARRGVARPGGHRLSRISRRDAASPRARGLALPAPARCSSRCSSPASSSTSRGRSGRSGWPAS